MNYERYTKLRYFLTRGLDVKLNDTFFDNKVGIECFVCCTLYGGHVGPKTLMLKLHIISCLFVTFAFVCHFVV